MIITTLSTPTVGQSLTLECSVTAVRGITSRVDVVWRRNGFTFERTEGVRVNSVTKDTLEFTDWYTTTQLNTNDDGITYLIQNSQAVKKACNPQKGYGEKRCEIQGGGQKMAVMVG